MLSPSSKRHATRLSRFILAGSAGTAVHFGVLALFIELIKTSVVTATTTAFIAAAGVSFALQKFWTFENKERNGVHVQAFLYVSVAALNVGLNAVLMYLLVDVLGVHYLIGQTITSGSIAVESYFLYKNIFATTSLPAEHESLDHRSGL